jgi:hypothetical protein
MVMKKTAAYLSLFLLLLLSAACGGSSSGGGGGNPSTPSISSVNFLPSSAAHGSNTTFTVTFAYSDGGGDLDGGAFKWIYDNVTRSTTLPNSLAGSTSGTTTVTLQTITLNATVGNVSIPVSLTDKNGNTSTSLSISISQT